MILFQTDGTSGWEQVLLPMMLLSRESLVQGEVLELCFGWSSCSCSAPLAALVLAALACCSHSLTAVCKSHPGSRAHLQPCLCSTALAGSDLQPGLWPGPGHFLQKHPGRCGCCRCHTPRGHSHSVWGHLSPPMSRAAGAILQRGIFVISFLGRGRSRTPRSWADVTFL